MNVPAGASAVQSGECRHRGSLLLCVIHVTSPRCCRWCSSSTLLLQISLLKRLHRCVDRCLHLLIEARSALTLLRCLLLLPLLLLLMLLLLHGLLLLLMLNRLLRCMVDGRRAANSDEGLVSISHLQLIRDAPVCFPH